MALDAAAAAKGALRRLAQERLEPTPDNYARAFAEESGQRAASPVPAAAVDGADSAANGRAWATLIEKLARQLERSSRQWTTARKKDSLKRVLDGSRSDAQRLLQRLQSLASAWEDDVPVASAGVATQDGENAPADAAPPAVPGLQPAQPLPPGPASQPPLPAPALQPPEPAPASPALSTVPTVPDADAATWQPMLASYGGTLRAALPADEPPARALAERLADIGLRIGRDGASAALLAEVQDACAEAGRVFGQGHRRVHALGQLCDELAAGMAELAEDDSWARGQVESLRARLDGGVNHRSVRAASTLLAETRSRQQQVRTERAAAREALKGLITRMLSELSELDASTGRFEQATVRHADAVAGADTLESLAGVVRAMLDDSRDVQAAVGRARQRLDEGQQRAGALQRRVGELEAELRRLSDEVSTDALTQVANRRGLVQAFEAELSRRQRHAGAVDGAVDQALDGAGDAAAGPGEALSVALIDIDNFKKLNDSLGHAAGDQALKLLAAAVRERLRPGDHLARYGGEEFVILLPGSEVADAQAALTRLQRSLTAALFLHESREVFITFSGGVTAWRPGETLESALERADDALYEAKRSGKNRCCIG